MVAEDRRFGGELRWRRWFEVLFFLSILSFNNFVCLIIVYFRYGLCLDGRRKCWRVYLLIVALHCISGRVGLNFYSL
ncbi:hypothetical protein BDV30DRAFT_181648 [Aspergillus minisclerotigenes]|uniref:Uncharacterized protein n=1 Tax=Aspergillus minisclerotigenes TaxID=656917 RepID=A0A5N6JFF3_9EURO|nr:hypothetical protein BDV30DRAFT_181648 [Aspergillus minisclerotigenes]